MWVYLAPIVWFALLFAFWRYALPLMKNMRKVATTRKAFGFIETCDDSEQGRYDDEFDNMMTIELVRDPAFAKFAKRYTR